jgi:hypothetical protein
MKVLKIFGTFLMILVHRENPSLCRRIDWQLSSGLSGQVLSFLHIKAQRVAKVLKKYGEFCSGVLETDVAETCEFCLGLLISTDCHVYDGDGFLSFILFRRLSSGAIAV